MDIIRLYLKDIKDIPLLTAEREQELAKKIKKGNKEARAEMIRSNLRLVINIAKRYKYFGVSISDLIEEGNLGLMKAVSKFDPKKGYRFSTYASWWIKQYITRAIANQGKTVRIPVYMAEIITRWRKVTEQLAHKLGRSANIKEVAKKMKMSTSKVQQINEIASKASSLDAPIGEDGSGQFMDLIEDERMISPTDELAKVLRKERVDALLNLISDREREILNLRFGLKDGTSHTLGETAKRFGITRERVRQIENAAMKKLKLYLAAQEGLDIEDDKKKTKSKKKSKSKVIKVHKKNLKGTLSRAKTKNKTKSKTKIKTKSKAATKKKKSPKKKEVPKKIKKAKAKKSSKTKSTKKMTSKKKAKANRKRKKN
jgi:RNA polymerase primary sigma factor